MSSGHWPPRLPGQPAAHHPTPSLFSAQGTDLPESAPDDLCFPRAPVEHHRLVRSLLSQRCLPKLCQEIVSEGKSVYGQFALDLGQPGGFLGVPDATCSLGGCRTEVQGGSERKV